MTIVTLKKHGPDHKLLSIDIVIQRWVWAVEHRRVIIIYISIVTLFHNKFNHTRTSSK